MIIVIGASSFIGVYTVNALLKNNCKVVATGRSNRFREHYKSLGVEYINLDLTNQEDFKQLPVEEVEGVILLAGLLPANAPVILDEIENAADYFAVNTIGTINVLEYCRVNKIKRIISTISYADVINSWSKDRPINEEEPRGFKFQGDHAVYVMSKNAASDVMEYYNQQHGMANAVFRLPPVYGVGPHGSLYVNGAYVKSGLQIFIEKAMNGQDIQVFGDKNVSRDVVYVKDVADAFVKAIRNDNTYGLYNITSGKGVTLDEQARVIAKVFAYNGKESKVIYRPDVQNISLSYVFDISKAGREFGYTPRYADFELMMKDYRYEMEREVFAKLFN